MAERKYRHEAVTYNIGSTILQLGYNRCAGLLTIWSDRYSFALHFLPHKKYWQLGYTEDWYDGPWYSFGFGPILLITWN